MTSPPGVLDGIALFDGFTADERARIAARGRLAEAPAGAVLIRQGDDADALYVLLAGEIRVLRWDAAGGEVEIGRRFTGECFGEMALLDGGPRSATVEAVTACRLFVLERSAFMEVVTPSPVLMAKLLSELSNKIRDVSARVVQDDLERRTRAAEAELARHRAITQAVTGLAHELNTPLGVCVTTASVIEAMALEGNEDLREPALLLVENLTRAVGLVETFTTIAALHHAEPLEDLDLVEVLEHAAAQFSMDRPGANLRIAIPVDGPRPWLGYRTHLQRALAQLFANAADHAYGPDGGPAVVTVDADRLDGRAAWRVTVRDHGRGVPDEAQRKVFDAFYTTARGKGHKGLGLTIVYNTVTGPLAGRVRVEAAAAGSDPDAPGGGTAVVMTFPREL